MHALSLECMCAGPVQFRHRYVDMSNVQVQASNYTRAGHTCKPAMGFSFAAGTTDGEPYGLQSILGVRCICMSA